MVVVENHGVRIEGSGAAVTSSGGDVQITGIGGNQATSMALIVTSSGAVSAAGGRTITLMGDHMHFDGTVSMHTTGGTVTLAPVTAGVAINLGSATDAATDTLELSDAELHRITAGTLQIGNPDASALHDCGSPRYADPGLPAT